MSSDQAKPNPQRRRQESDLVIVNSNGENKRWSPMSYVSAQITTSFGTSDGSIIPLYFFCGEHINWRKDRKAYPSSLMNSLIAQLLSHSHASNLSPTEHLTNKLKSGTTIDLCGAFKRLIKQIPDTVIVICVIDGISYFEDDERREDICTVVRSLDSLVHRGKGPLLKVLLGSPSSCRYVLRYVDKDSVVNILSICPTQGGFRQMQFHRLAQRAKEKVDAGSESK
ncbi:hypothetical protein BJY01DRAFT_241757 [Aspergillus pseudoustus]|uniref:Uncharacterized protein n=1 Tax=Aspergillus pseudoustus TaxID=1810923 RepID=A0ABR4L260_9EURO